MPEANEVRSMFARIAGRYDFLNRVLSMGIDQSWRRGLLRRAGDVRDQPVVDACCGTGDLTLAFQKAGAKVLGLDFTHEMLSHALPKRPQGNGPVGFVQGDALRMPVLDGSVAACSVAFGIRNVADRQAGLREMRRVLRPGGTALVLEFTRPRPGWFGSLYRFYFTRILPRIGGWISGDADAYSYLPRTVMEWPGPDELRAELEDAGLVECGYELFAGGIACLHWGRAPA